VRLQWTRQEELGLDPKGPQQLLEMRAAVEKTSDGARIMAWEAQMWVPAVSARPAPFVSLDAAAINQTRGQNSGLPQSERGYAIRHAQCPRGHALDEDHSPSSLQSSRSG